MPRNPALVGDDLTALAHDLKTVWQDARTDHRLKKRIVRTLIHEIVADVDADAGEVILIVLWPTCPITSTMRAVARNELPLTKARKAVSNVTSPASSPLY